MGDQLWLKAAERIARGAEPGRALVAGQEERKRRGLTGTPACAVIARSATASVWHTESTAVNDLPWWRPAFGGSRAEGLYRGFDREALGTVLQTGLDVPAQSSFFASDFPDKAWEYPTGRTLPAMMVLDGRKAASSFICKPADAADDSLADTQLYPHRYLDGSREIHTRFQLGPGTRRFRDENMYGFWVPGDARDALIAVVLGGPRESVLQGLHDVSRHVELDFA
jgi:hypothetical protein